MHAIKTRFGLTGNQLKLIAMVFMTIDHIGSYLLPELRILRIIGRLAMPIYAYMIAEGCHYTHDRKKYFLRIAGLALVCQVVYWIAQRSLYQCILVTFTLSVGLICVMEQARKETRPATVIPAVVLFAGILFVCQGLPEMVPGFHVDYSIWGVMLPVILYFGGRSIWVFLLGTFLLCLALKGIEWWAMAAVPLMALYNGQRGKHRLGWFFYLYYPLHLVVVYGISLLL